MHTSEGRIPCSTCTSSLDAPPDHPQGECSHELAFNLNTTNRANYTDPGELTVDEPVLNLHDGTWCCTAHWNGGSAQVICTTCDPQ